MWRVAILLVACLAVLSARGQPLRNPDNEATRLEQQPEAPLILRNAGNDAQPPESVQEVITRLREEMRAIAEAALTEEERREALEELYRRHARIFLEHSTERDGPILTADDAVRRLELMIFEVLMDLAPDAESRQRLAAGAPEHLHLEPNRPLLIAPRSTRSEIVVTRDAEAEGVITPWWKNASFDTEALDLEEVAESPTEQLEPAEENLEEEKEEVKPTVAVLSDEKATVQMHDDTTILRQVETARGDLVLFDALHIWVGGAVQFDGQAYDGLFNARNGGESDQDTLVRRGEVIVRSTLFDLGEFKWQYDLDSNLWRDLYYRRVNTDKSRTVTIGQ